MSALLLAVALTMPAAGRPVYNAGEVLIVAVPVPQGGGLAPVPAATNLAAVASLVQAQVAGDDVGVKQMVEQGTAVLIPSGSSARVIKPYPTSPAATYEVRILDGTAKDRSAFMPEPWLVSPQQFRALAAEAKAIAKSREARARKDKFKADARKKAEARASANAQSPAKQVEAKIKMAQGLEKAKKPQAALKYYEEAYEILKDLDDSPHAELVQERIRALSPK
jgi:hypothetical protein